jgi:choline dehydrogenase-like flavoprotein
MADSNCIKCDVAIVGSGFAGALIANELSQKGISVVILEAGPGVPPNINDYMKTFYGASAKVPESPFPPKFQDADGKTARSRAGSRRQTDGSVHIGVNVAKPKQSYLLQDGKRRPFMSTYERVAGGTSHWLGTSLRFVPRDFTMKTSYGKSQSELPVPGLAKSHHFPIAEFMLRAGRGRTWRFR